MWILTALTVIGCINNIEMASYNQMTEVIPFYIFIATVWPLHSLFVHVYVCMYADHY